MANVYDLMKEVHHVATAADSKVYGVEIGLVTNVQDPEQLGRVKVQFPRLPGKPESSWVRVIQPAAGPGRGFYWLPEVSDEVLIAFERGEAHRPYVVGSLWNGKDKPMKDAYTDANTTRMIMTKSGHQIILSDEDGAEKIIISDKTGKRTVTFDVKSKKLLIEDGIGDVELKAEKKIILDCEDLEIKTSKTGKVDIGDAFDLSVGDKANFKAGPKLTLKASKIELNPSSAEVATLAALAWNAATAATAPAPAPAPAGQGAAPAGGPPGTVPTQDVVEAPPAAAPAAAAPAAAAPPAAADPAPAADAAPASAAPADAAPPAAADQAPAADAAPASAAPADAAPADSSQPADSGQAEPQPADSGQSTQPADSGQSTQPADSGQAEPQPADSGQSAQPADSGQAEPQPADSGQAEPQPADSGQSTQPADSGQSTQPADSGQSTQPADSGQAAQPAPKKPDETKVKSSQITVAGKPFVDWFNKTLRPPHQETFYKPRIHDAGLWTQIWDNIEGLTGKPEATLNEFLAYHFVIYKETAYASLPVVEDDGTKSGSPHAGDAYFFNYNGHKGLGNKKAGDQLVEAKILDTAKDSSQVKKWNQKGKEKYPSDAPAGQKAAARKTDFFKFRGRGLCQLTGRNNYVKIVNPLLPAGKTVDSLNDDELTELFRDLPFCLKVFNGFFSRLASVVAGVNGDNPDWHAVGIAVNGTGAGGETYAAELGKQCTTALGAIKAAKLVLG